MYQTWHKCTSNQVASLKTMISCFKLTRIIPCPEVTKLNRKTIHPRLWAIQWVKRVVKN